MTCHECEHNKQRAQLWRNEAYKHAGHPLDWEPELMLRPKPLTEDEALDIARTFGAQPWPPGSCVAFARAIERAHNIKE